jgi:membrane associated rhomboid family serine protease
MEKHFKFTNSVIGLPLFFVVFLWFVFWLEIRFDFDFVHNGIYPRSFSGLQGVIFCPFIHADMKHLCNNSFPLIMLLAALQFFYAKQSFQIIGYGIIVSGCITWIIGRENYHIGASGLIYVLFSFIFPTPSSVGENSISWEGHLGGLLTGFFFSLYYKTPEYKKVIKYDWERPDFDPSEDKFMQRFDVNGNFVNLPEIEELEEQQVLLSYYTSSYPVIYELCANKKNESKPES